jgi:hypothetical protein
MSFHYHPDEDRLSEVFIVPDHPFNTEHVVGVSSAPGVEPHCWVDRRVLGDTPEMAISLCLTSLVEPVRALSIALTQAYDAGEGMEVVNRGMDTLRAACERIAKIDLALDRERKRIRA